MHGGYDEEQEEIIPEIPKERKTLLPITIKILNDSIINQNDKVEYRNIPLFQVK